MNKGRRHYFYTKKFWEKFPISPEFQNYLKKADPPLGLNSDFFEFENILTAKDPLGQTSEKGY